MGLFNSMANYAHKSELRESKDEIVCGEIIRGLSHQGWRPFRIVAYSDRQQMGFKVPGDPDLVGGHGRTLRTDVVTRDHHIW